MWCNTNCKHILVFYSQALVSYKLNRPANGVEDKRGVFISEQHILSFLVTLTAVNIDKFKGTIV